MKKKLKKEVKIELKKIKDEKDYLSEIKKLEKMIEETNSPSKKVLLGREKKIVEKRLAKYEKQNR